MPPKKVKTMKTLDSSATADRDAGSLGVKTYIITQVKPPRKRNESQKQYRSRLSRMMVRNKRGGIVKFNEGGGYRVTIAEALEMGLTDQPNIQFDGQKGNLPEKNEKREERGEQDHPMTFLAKLQKVALDIHHGRNPEPQESLKETSELGRYILPWGTPIKYRAISKQSSSKSVDAAAVCRETSVYNRRSRESRPDQSSGRDSTENSAQNSPQGSTQSSIRKTTENSSRYSLPGLTEKFIDNSAVKSPDFCIRSTQNSDTRASQFVLQNTEQSSDEKLLLSSQPSTASPAYLENAPPPIAEQFPILEIPASHRSTPHNSKATASRKLILSPPTAAFPHTKFSTSILGRPVDFSFVKQDEKTKSKFAPAALVSGIQALPRRSDDRPAAVSKSESHSQAHPQPLKRSPVLAEEKEKDEKFNVDRCTVVPLASTPASLARSEMPTPRIEYTPTAHSKRVSWNSPTEESPITSTPELASQKNSNKHICHEEGDDTFEGMAKRSRTVSTFASGTPIRTPSPVGITRGTPLTAFRGLFSMEKGIRGAGPLKVPMAMRSPSIKSPVQARDSVAVTRTKEVRFTVELENIAEAKEQEGEWGVIARESEREERIVQVACGKIGLKEDITLTKSGSPHSQMTSTVPSSSNSLLTTPVNAISSTSVTARSGLSPYGSLSGSELSTDSTTRRNTLLNTPAEARERDLDKDLGSAGDVRSSGAEEGGEGEQDNEQSDDKH